MTKVTHPDTQFPPEGSLYVDDMTKRTIRGRVPVDHRLIGDPACDCETCERFRITKGQDCEGGECGHWSITAFRKGFRCEPVIEWFLGDAGRHGKSSTYSGYGCRCAPCRQDATLSVYTSTKGPALQRLLDWQRASIPVGTPQHPDHPLWNLPPAHKWAAAIVFEPDDWRHPACPPEQRAASYAEAIRASL